MKAKKNQLVIAAAILCCAAAAWFSTAIQGGQKRYEIEPRLTLPESRNDLDRIVDAYERLMDRYMALTESNSAMIGTDLKSVLGKLDSIDGRLTDLSARMTRIEQALGLEKPNGPQSNGQSSIVNPSNELPDKSQIKNHK